MRHWKSTTRSYACALLGMVIAATAALSASAKPERLDLPYLEWFKELRGVKHASRVTLPAACGRISARDKTRAPANGCGSKVLQAPVRLDPLVTGEGALADRYGFALAWSGDTLLVGAIGDEVSQAGLPAGASSGSVHVYRANGNTWTLEAKLLPDASFGDDRFGFSVAMSGELAVVGAPFAPVAGATFQGAAWVYERTGTTWTLRAKLSASDGAAEDRFGWSVAIDGDTVVVGAPRNGGRGAAYVFSRNGPNWMQQAKLAGAGIDAEMGYAVGVSGGTTLVGAPRHEVSGAPSDSGAVFRFDRSGNNWTTSGAFADPSTSAAARFGHALAFAGTRAVIGASGDAVDALAARGSAFVYQVTAGTTLERAKLVAGDGVANDGFGAAVAFDGASVLVGAPGADAYEGGAYVFVESGPGFVAQARLSAADGVPPDIVGGAVALQGDRALLGAELDNLPPNRAQGSVKRFERVGTTWSALPQLDTGQGAANDLFGFAVAVDGDTALVGAYRDDTVEAEDDAGTATVYRRNGTGWMREAVLKAPDAETEDRFGVAVALQGDRALVGAYWDIIGGRFNQGSAYVFRREPGGWVFEAKLVAPDGAANDYFGFALALDGERALVGAPAHDGANADTGAVYVFRRNPTSWTLEQKLAETDWPAAGFAGLAVAIEGNRLVVGAPQTPVGTTRFRGVAHVFTHSGMAWVPQATVASSDGEAGDYFGGSVAIAGTSLLVGAPGANLGSQMSTGAAYVFSGNGNSWVQSRRFNAPAPAPLDSFGYAVALFDTQALVGAPNADAGAEDAGAAFAYERGDGTWPLQQALVGDSAQGFTYFGTSVALDFAQGMVGEPERDRDNPQEGAATIFSDDDRLFQDGFE